MLFARNTSPSVQKKLTTSTDGTLLGPAGGHVRRLAPFTLQKKATRVFSVNTCTVPVTRLR